MLQVVTFDLRYGPTPKPQNKKKLPIGKYKVPAKNVELGQSKAHCATGPRRWAPPRSLPDTVMASLNGSQASQLIGHDGSMPPAPP